MDKWLLQNKRLFSGKSSAPGSEAAWDKWLLQKKSYAEKKVLPQAAKLPEASGLFKRLIFFRRVLPQAAKLPGTNGWFKKVIFLRKSSARGSEVARDKWFVQKKRSDFLRQTSAPGSEAAPDKWLSKQNVEWLPRTSDSPQKMLNVEKKFCPRQRSCPGQVVCSEKMSDF